MALTLASEPKAMSAALFQITHGLYIVTSTSRGRANGQCLDALMQVTNVPPRVAIGIGNQTLTHEMIAATGRLVVSVLDRNDPSCPDVIRRFGFQSGRDVDKFAGFPHETTERGIPYLPNAVAVFELSVLPEFTHNLGTHSLLVAVVDRAASREGGEPLTYNEYRKTMRRK
ncbi:MAG: flavin reductase family protein [Candidatus Bipolaricaulia bacterium]